MRLLIKISPKQNTPQPLNQYHIQSCIYNLLKKTKFDNLHSHKRYKYFCFSNIFPFRIGHPLKKDKEYSFLISSPDLEFSKVLHNKVTAGVNLKIGKFEFMYKNCCYLRASVKTDNVLKTSTPIVISIPSNLYKRYGIESKRVYLYWNNKMHLNAFVDALSKNAVRKFNRFYKKNYQEDSLLFKTYRYKRGAIVRYKNNDIAGSIWEFTPADDEKALEILNFILDAGIGEKNSAGFGFLNVERKV